MLASLADIAQAAEQVALQIVAPDDIDLVSTGAPVPADPRSIVVFGSLDGPNFSVSSPNEVTVVGPHGASPPLSVEQKSIFRDLDRIVSMRFAFIVPQELLTSGTFHVKWGNDVQVANTVGEKLALASVQRDRVRQFRLITAPRASAEPSDATIEIVADSHADYYFLWYLLPISVVFALLTFRRLHDGHSAH
jgi:hypothetical protein